MTAWPSRSLRARLRTASATLRITSDWAYRSASVDTIVRTGLRVGRIRERRAGACAGFDEDLEPGRCQLAERFGYQGDAPFAGRGLPGDADLHGHHL
jgi:hypothetical protein